MAVKNGARAFASIAWFSVEIKTCQIVNRMAWQVCPTCRTFLSEQNPIDRRDEDFIYERGAYCSNFAV